MNPRYSSTARFFTLLELTIVLLVLGVLLGVAAPSLRGFARGRETAEEARRLLALSRYARSEAISRSDMIELWLDPGSGSYGIRSLLFGAGKAMADITEVLPEGIVLVIEREKLTSEERCSLVWLPDGALECADLLAVQLVNTRDQANCPVLVPDPLRSCLVIATEDGQ